MGTPATKWEYRYLAFGLLNTHTLLVSKLDTVRPVRYEMKGYDSLMASYYDSYVLEYISFEEWKPDLEKFELPKGQSIKNFLLVKEHPSQGLSIPGFLSMGQLTMTS